MNIYEPTCLVIGFLSGAVGSLVVLLRLKQIELNDARKESASLRASNQWWQNRAREVMRAFSISPSNEVETFLKSLEDAEDIFTSEARRNDGEISMEEAFGLGCKQKDSL